MDTASLHKEVRRDQPSTSPWGWRPHKFVSEHEQFAGLNIKPITNKDEGHPGIQKATFGTLQE